MSMTSHGRPRWRLLVPLVWIAAIAAACGGGDADSDGGPTGPSASCNFRLTRTTVAADAGGESVRVNVSARADCAWTATSGASWIAITPASGTGDGVVQITVAATDALDARTGSITIAGQTVTVTQEAPNLSGRWGLTGTGGLRALEFTVRGTMVTRVRFTFFFTVPPNRVCDRAFTEDVMIPIVDRQFTVDFFSNGMSAALAVQFQSPGLATGTLGTQTFTNSTCGAGPPISGSNPGGEVSFGRLD